MSETNTQDRSEQIHELAAALAKAQGAIQGAAKTNLNPAFKSRYADLASVWDACRAPLSTNGLSVAQLPRIEDGGRVAVTTVLLHTSGQFLSATISVQPVKTDAQGIGSAITYLRRYGLSAMVGVAPDDDDGNAASGTSGQREPVAAAKREPESPEGFAAWWASLPAIATKGVAALQTEWAESSPEFKRFVQATLRAEWDGLKAIAFEAAQKSAEAVR